MGWINEYLEDQFLRQQQEQRQKLVEMGSFIASLLLESDINQDEKEESISSILFNFMSHLDQRALKNMCNKIMSDFEEKGSSLFSQKKTKSVNKEDEDERQHQKQRDTQQEQTKQTFASLNTNTFPLSFNLDADEFTPSELVFSSQNERQGTYHDNEIIVPESYNQHEKGEENVYYDPNYPQNYFDEYEYYDEQDDYGYHDYGYYDNTFTSKKTIQNTTKQRSNLPDFLKFSFVLDNEDEEQEVRYFSPQDFLIKLFPSFKYDQLIDLLEKNCYDMEATIDAVINQGMSVSQNEEENISDDITSNPNYNNNNNSDGSAPVRANQSTFITASSIPVIDKEEEHLYYGEVHPQKRRLVCRHFLAGTCYRKDCWFSHQLESKICKFWLQGSCLIGDSCTFSHGDNLFSKINKGSKNSSFDDDVTNKSQITSPDDILLEDEDAIFPVLASAKVRISADASSNVIENTVTNNLKDDTLYIKPKIKYHSDKMSTISSKNNGEYPWSFQSKFASENTSIESISNPSWSNMSKELELIHDDSFQKSSTSNLLAPPPSSYFNHYESNNQQEEPDLKTSFTQFFNNDLSNSKSAMLHTPFWLITGDPLNDQFLSFRQEAKGIAVARNRLFDKAAEAYISGNGLLAKTLSLEANSLNTQMHDLHTKAAKEILSQNRQSNTYLLEKSMQGDHYDRSFAFAKQGEVGTFTAQEDKKFLHVKPDLSQEFYEKLAL